MLYTTKSNSLSCHNAQPWCHGVFYDANIWQTDFINLRKIYIDCTCEQVITSLQGLLIGSNRKIFAFPNPACQNDTVEFYSLG